MSQSILGKHGFLGAVVTGISMMGAAGISSAATALIDFGNSGADILVG